MVIFIVMILVYGLMDRMKIFKTDGQFTKQLNNQRVTYMHQKWEEYGYLDYLPYSDYLAMLQESGEIDEAARSALSSIGRSADGSDDSPEVAEYVAKFNDYCREEGYTVTRLDAIISKNRLATGGGQVLFAYKEKNVLSRLWKYFTGIFEIDNIHKVPEDQDIGERGLTFTLYDPVYGGEKFSPAIIGNGTIHRYLLYFDDQFPYIHQNFLNLHLGASYSVTRGVEVFNSMTQGQGSYRQFPLTYPTGLTENSADNLHTAVYVAGSREANVMYQQRYTDDYTNVQTFRNNKSRMGYSFVIGADNACYKRRLLLKNRENGQVWAVAVSDRFRRDIRENLKDQTNVDLTGFAARLEEGAVPPGVYQFGMLAEDKCSRQKLVNWSNWILEVGTDGKTYHYNRGHGGRCTHRVQPASSDPG